MIELDVAGAFRCWEMCPILFPNAWACLGKSANCIQSVIRLKHLFCGRLNVVVSLRAASRLFV